MSRKRRFVNRNSGRKFEEVFDSFIIAKTAKGVSDVTIRNYHQNLHNISLHFDITMPLGDLRDCKFLLQWYNKEKSEANEAGVEYYVLNSSIQSDLCL